MGIKPNDASRAPGAAACSKTAEKIHPSPLSTDQLEEMNFLITQSITEDQAICVTYAEAGRKEQFWGWVKAIHYETQRIKIVNDEDVLNLSLQQIVAIDLD